MFQARPDEPPGKFLNQLHRLVKLSRTVESVQVVALKTFFTLNHGFIKSSSSGWLVLKQRPLPVKMNISSIVAQKGFGPSRNSLSNKMRSFTRPRHPHLPPVLIDKAIRQPDQGGGGGTSLSSRLFIHHPIWQKPRGWGSKRFELAMKGRCVHSCGGDAPSPPPGQGCGGRGRAHVLLSN